MIKTKIKWYYGEKIYNFYITNCRASTDYSNIPQN